MRGRPSASSGEQAGIDLDRGAVAEVAHPQVPHRYAGRVEQRAYGGLGALHAGQPVAA